MDKRDAVIVEAVRTPVGRGHKEKGYYKDVHPATLLGATFVGLLDRAGIDPAEVEDILSGCAYQMGEQSANVARAAWLQEGLPIETACTTVDTRCGSGQQAVNLAALRISGGVNDVIVAAGVEHMGRVGFPVNSKVQEMFGGPNTEKMLDRYQLIPQGLGAEMIADQWEVPRSELDEIALRSHLRADRATQEGLFDREIMPFQVNGDTYTTDQGIRPNTTLETLAALKPAFKEDGKVTAGNASQISDGAAALLMMSRGKAESLGLRPRAEIIDQITVGVDPVTMLTGPIPATAKLLERNKMKIDDIDYVEINEAFAPVVAAWQRESGADLSRVNPRGGAIALGHPLGSTGARLMTTLLHELEDDDKEIGLVTMCCGGGLGTGTLLRRI